jgi:putative copper resistance protein D
MTGVPLSQVDRGALGLVLSVPSLGLSFGIRAAALLAVAALGLIRLPAVPRLWAMLAASAIALATLAGVGHANMDSGALGWLHLTGDILHLLAAALWIGAIAGLLAMAVKARRASGAEQLDHVWRALAGFATVGTIAVSVIVVTGLINMSAIVGASGIPSLPATLYGRLLILKLVLFVAMLALAAMNRFRHVPRLEEMMRGRGAASALLRLRRSLVAEAACGVAILILVAWLGALDPGGSQ